MSESLRDKLDKVCTAVNEKYSTQDNYVWAKDVLDDSVIIDMDGETWKIGYTIADDGTITFAGRADWEKVVGKEYKTVQASEYTKQYDFTEGKLTIFLSSEPTGPFIDSMYHERLQHKAQ